MRDIVICQRIGEEKTILSGGEVRPCVVCKHPIRVSEADLGTRCPICRPCAQVAELVPRDDDLTSGAERLAVGDIVICPRVGEEKTSQPGGAVVPCWACECPIRVAEAESGPGRCCICSSCAQKNEIVPWDDLTAEQRATFTEEQRAARVPVSLGAYHAERRA